MKVLIIGCGYLGSFVGKSLISKGHRVWGVRRDPGRLEGTPIEGLKADLSDLESLQILPAADWVVLCQAPSRDEDTYEHTYLEGTRNVIAALEPVPSKIVFVSSTGVYGVSDGSWVYETTGPAPQGYADEREGAKAKTILEAEKVVFDSGIPASVLRLGGVYGPGRNRVKPLREGRLKPVFSDAYTNRIHVEDAAAAVELLLEKGAPGNVYLGVDDAPVTQKEFYGWLTARLGMPVSSGNEKPSAAGKRCANAKLKDLGFRPKYPTYKEGYEPLLAEK